MEFTYNNPSAAVHFVSLHSMVSSIITTVSPRATRHNTFMVNDIPATLNVFSNTETIETILSTLFATVALHSENSCIHISAKVYRNIILLYMSDHNSINTYTIANSLQSAQPIAEKIGGFLGVTSQRKNETTIVFSFPNIGAAA